MSEVLPFESILYTQRRKQRGDKIYEWYGLQKVRESIENQACRRVPC